MSKQDRINELTSRVSKQQSYIFDLKNRCNKALSALADLAAGYGRKRGTDNPAWEVCMRILASEELATIAKMPLREVL